MARGVLDGTFMHTPLTAKRIYLLAGKIARCFAGLTGMTPARVDLLLLLREGELVQRDIGRLLCVCPSVITRLVNALQKLGLVRRRVPDEDRRLRLVSLTDKGTESFQDIFDGWFRDDDMANVEAAAEQTLADDWDEALTNARVRDDPHMYRDQTDLVFTMSRAVRATDYFKKWTGAPTRRMLAYARADLAALLRAPAEDVLARARARLHACCACAPRAAATASA